MIETLLAALGTGVLDALGTKLGASRLLGVFDTQREQTQQGVEDALKYNEALTRSGMYSPAGYTGPSAGAMAQLALMQPDFSADAMRAAARARGDASTLRELARESSRRAIAASRGTASELGRQLRSMAAAGGSGAALAGALRAAGEASSRQLAQQQLAAAQNAQEALRGAAQVELGAQQALDQNRRAVFETRKQPYLVGVHGGAHALANQLGSRYGETVGINNPFGTLTKALGQMVGTRMLQSLFGSPYGAKTPVWVPAEPPEQSGTGSAEIAQQLGQEESQIPNVYLGRVPYLLFGKHHFWEIDPYFFGLGKVDPDFFAGLGGYTKTLGGLVGR